MKVWQRKVLQVGGKRISVWPGSTGLKQIDKHSIFMVKFDDTECYHPDLQKTILDRETNPQYGLKLYRGACGVKVHHVDRWKSPAANLLHQRALALFCAATGSTTPVADLSWANVYRFGDYCLPHSHLRTEASVVYHLRDGDSDDDNPLGGRISFADSRMKSCCADEPGRVTYSLMPDMAPGRMIIFPSYLMHYVNPYTGDTPRISLSWNISTGKVTGSPFPELDAERAKLAAKK
jgi:hypothetical protein